MKPVLVWTRGWASVLPPSCKIQNRPFDNKMLWTILNNECDFLIHTSVTHPNTTANNNVQNKLWGVKGVGGGAHGRMTGGLNAE